MIPQFHHLLNLSIVYSCLLLVTLIAFVLVCSERKGSTSSESTSSCSEGNAGFSSDEFSEYDSDDAFSDVHDKIFNRVHARNIHNNLWNSSNW